MKKVITYGTYDLLHQGHINLLRRAKELGDYLIVGVTSDSFDRGRGKLNVRNNVLERVEAVKATGYADEVIMAAGAFVQGASIELSCDGPMKPPYTGYLQGGLTYESGKYGILKAAAAVGKREKQTEK